MFNRQKKPIENPYGDEIQQTTPLEYIAFQIPRRALSFLILATAGVLGMLGLIFVNYFIIGITDIVTTLVFIIQGVISIIFFLQAFLIYKNTIKKGDNIILREQRGGLFTFDKQSLRKKILFNKKDPTTEPTILWNGTAIEPQSGAKVILLKEGSKSNENINLCVTETDWTKNLASMVRAKTFADIAESELLNTQTLFGLKWQDILLIIIGLITIVLVILIIGVNPGMVADEVIKQIPGTITNAVKSIVLPGGV